MATKQTFTAGQVLTAAQLNTLQDYVGVVQVKSATKTDTFTTASTSFVDITGLTISITPTSATNKIFVIASLVGGNTTGTNVAFLQFTRGVTAIDIGDAAGSRQQVTSIIAAGNTSWAESISMTFLDSPATTSATTYAVQIKTNGSGSAFVNRSSADTDSAALFRATSTITVMEVTP
jgi:hypothetical protein